MACFSSTIRDIRRNRCNFTVPFLGPSMWHIVEGGAYPVAVEGNRQSPIDVQTNKVCSGYLLH